MRDFSRQAGLLSEADRQRYPLTVVGCGGIGSWLSLMLAWEGYRPPTVYDFDTVAPENSSQAFWPEHLGRPKVEALKEIVERTTGVLLIDRPKRYAADERPRGIVIAAVDSMAERQVIWQTVKENAVVPLFLDGRMGGEEGRLYAVNPCHPHDVDCYEQTLYSDAEAAAIPCSQRSIVHTLWVIAGLIGAQLASFLKDGSFAPEILFDLTTNTWLFRKGGGNAIAASRKVK